MITAAMRPMISKTPIAAPIPIPAFAPTDSPPFGTVVVALVLVGFKEAEAADDGVWDEVAIAAADVVVVDVVAIPLFMPTIANANTKEVSVKVVG